MPAGERCAAGFAGSGNGTVIETQSAVASRKSCHGPGAATGGLASGRTDRSPWAMARIACGNIRTSAARTAASRPPPGIPASPSSASRRSSFTMEPGSVTSALSLTQSIVALPCGGLVITPASVSNAAVRGMRSWSSRTTMASSAPGCGPNAWPARLASVVRQSMSALIQATGSPAAEIAWAFAASCTRSARAAAGSGAVSFGRFGFTPSRASLAASTMASVSVSNSDRSVTAHDPGRRHARGTRVVETWRVTAVASSPPLAMRRCSTSRGGPASNLTRATCGKPVNTRPIRWRSFARRAPTIV